MKYLTLIVVFTALVVHGEEPKTKSSKNTDKSANAAGQASSATAPSILVVHQEATSGEQDSHAKKPESYLCTLLSAQNLPNIALVIVTAITAWYIAKQAKETANATKAMGDTVSLQKSAMRQWISIETRNAAVSDKEAEPEINFSFQAFNDTAYPLTIIKIETWVGYWSDTWDKSTAETNHTLPPWKGEKRPYFFYAVFKGQSEIIEAFKKGTIFTINGAITYIDCLEVTRVQEFGGLYFARPDKFDWLEPLGTAPDHEKKSKTNS
jgi:hypothetical protein